MSLIKVWTHSHDRAHWLQRGPKILQDVGGSKYLPLTELIRGTGRLPRRCFAVFTSCVIQRAAPCEPDPVTARVCTDTWAHACDHTWTQTTALASKEACEMETLIPVSCAFSSTVIIPPSATHQLAYPIFGLINQQCVIIPFPPFFHRSYTLFQFSC